MNKPILYKVFILIAGLIAVLVVFWQKDNNTNKPAPASSNQAQEAKIEGSVIDREGGESFNVVSLPALMEKQFDGRDLKLGRVLDNNSAYTRYYITYKSGQLTISGIMNIPKGPGTFPLLILNHGHIDTAVYTNGRGLKREQDYLARRGFAVLHPDYRDHAQSDKDPDTDVNFRLGYVEDVINAILAVKNSNSPQLANVDTKNIGMLGHSMGGGVTLGVLVARPDLVQAAVLFAPVSGDVRDNFARWIERRPETAQRIIQKFGSPEDSPDFWDNVSPRTFYEKILTPILLHHGTADDSVPIQWSDKLDANLKAQDKQITYKTYPGQPHEFTSAWPAVMRSSSDFFKQHLVK